MLLQWEVSFGKKTDLLLSSLKICLLIEKKTATTTKNRYTSVLRHLVIFVGKNKNLKFFLFENSVDHKILIKICTFSMGYIIFL